MSFAETSQSQMDLLVAASRADTVREFLYIGVKYKHSRMCEINVG